MSLDDMKIYSTYDKEEISFGIEHLPEQLREAWELVEELALPTSYKKPVAVYVVGMGGSALGPHMVQSLFATRAKCQIEVVRDYRIPAGADKKSLVILSSFSGSTEEVLAAAKEGKKRGLKMVTIGAGGTLAGMAKRNRWPRVVFAPGELAKEPRLGLGFSLISFLGVLRQAGVLPFSQADVRRMMAAMADVIATCSLDVSAKENPAKIVANECTGRALLVVGAEHLVGNAHVFQNQVNETAKQVCFYDVLPELNHHRLEGFTHPKGMFKNYTVIMLRSELYHARVQERFNITAEVFEQLGAKVIDYNCGGGSFLEESAELLQFSSFVSYYLGMLNKVNPMKIPYVDWFKKQLGKRK